MDSGLKIVSFNAKGLNSPFKRSEVWKEAKGHKADIVCIQETHLNPNDTYRLNHKNFPLIINSPAIHKKGGVAIAFRDSLLVQTIDTTIDEGGRFIIYIGKINNNLFTLVVVYGPNKKQLKYYKGLFDKIRGISQGSQVVIGDFNITSWPELDISSGTPNTPPSSFFSLTYSHQLMAYPAPLK